MENLSLGMERRNRILIGLLLAVAALLILDLCRPALGGDGEEVKVDVERTLQMGGVIPVSVKPKFIPYSDPRPMTAVGFNEANLKVEVTRRIGNASGNPCYADPGLDDSATIKVYSWIMVPPKPGAGTSFGGGIPFAPDIGDHDGFTAENGAFKKGSTTVNIPLKPLNVTDYKSYQGSKNEKFLVIMAYSFTRDGDGKARMYAASEPAILPIRAKSLR